MFGVHCTGWQVASDRLSLWQEKDPFWCNRNSQQHRFWQLFFCNRDDGIGHKVAPTKSQMLFSRFCTVECHSTIQIRSYQIPISTASRQFCLWFPCFAHGHLFVEKGLRGVHADKSAASICKLRQWRSQQPSCLDYIVLDDRLSVIDCNIICECSVTATREGSPVVRLKQPATQILTALLLRQRRWDRPLGTMHCAASKCQLIQQFATIQVTKCAICPCKESCTHQKTRGIGIMHTAVQVWATPCVSKAELNAFECFWPSTTDAGSITAEMAAPFLKFQVETDCSILQGPKCSNADSDAIFCVMPWRWGQSTQGLSGLNTKFMSSSEQDLESFFHSHLPCEN